MKRIAIILLLAALPLSGCGAASSETEALRHQYGLIDTAQMEAEVTFHADGGERCFTLQCEYTPERSAVTVTAPETVAGVSAVLTGEELTLTYDGESLSVGNIGGVNPLSALPMLLQTVADGYLLSEGAETVEDTACCRLTLERTAGGEQVVCNAWIDSETLLPRWGEFAIDGETVVSIKMLAFSCTLREETTEE